MELDAKGGTTYTEMGTSQLLSVPYAIHAKTVKNITETDPVFGTSVATGITGIDTTNWNNKLDSFTETQNLADVIAINNSANARIKDLTDPTDAQDAATKAYVDLLQQEICKIKKTIEAGGTVTDYDGNVYNTVQIGNQVWMAENLKTTHYNNGTTIPLVTDSTTWANLTTGGYCWYSNDSVTYANPYGALYNWYTVNTGNLCPTGWHVPTDGNWTTLTDYLGGKSVAGGKLKETGTTHWDSPNIGATNETGFTALPGGNRLYNGFYYIGHYACWWSDTEYDFDDAWTRFVSNFFSSVYEGYAPKISGLSVRCLRD